MGEDVKVKMIKKFKNTLIRGTKCSLMGFL